MYYPSLRASRPLALAAAITTALLHAAGVTAGTVPPGPPVIVDGQVTPLEVWDVQSDGTLRVINGSVVNAVSVHHAALEVNGSEVRSTAPVGILANNGSTVTLNGATVSASNTGLALASDSGVVGQGEVVHASVVGSHISGIVNGASTTANAVLDVSASTLTGTGANSYGFAFYSGNASFTNGSVVTGQASGVQVMGITSVGVPDGGRLLVVDGSTVRGIDGSAITVIPRGARATTVTVALRNGASLESGNGTAIGMAANTSTDIDIDASDIRGDIVAESGADARVTMHDAATLSGRVTGDVAMTLASGTRWNLPGDADVSSLTLGGAQVQVGTAADPTYRNLHVRGDLAGSGGDMTLHTAMNAGGPLSAQQTDRVLIHGNVSTTGTTYLTVMPVGEGAATDLNQNGAVEAAEGISLVQVGGTSRANAFALRGSYVAAGPWQYTLHAFGPGEADQSQSALGTGPLNWDYRLGNHYVCQSDCDPVDPTKPVDPADPGDPENPGDPGNPVDPVVPPENGRVAVVPQLPSYLSAPAALLTYGDMMNDGLHQRLGDLRTGSSHDPVGGEVFARYLGGQLRYSSNLSFQRYGYDFDQQVNALQVGGSLIALDGDNGTLRAGWAADHGTTRVTPEAADGNSSAKYRANGMSAWITWQQGSGLWVDGVLGATSYSGDVGTDLRGADVGRVRANGWTMSVETGMPFALGHEWTIEPRFQLKHQSLNFRDFTDGDGLDVRLGTAKQTSATLGGRIMRTANPVFMPYANLDLTHTSNGDPNADVASSDWDLSQRFGSGRVGNSYKVAAGAVSQLGEHLQVYGEGTYQHFVGSYGMRGWAGNVGVRVTF